MARRRSKSNLSADELALKAGEASAEAAYRSELKNRAQEAEAAVAEAAEGVAAGETVEVVIESVVPDLTAAAFFDVDNTIMEGASTFHFARGLAARKFFTTGDLVGFAWKQIKFRLSGESADDMAEARQDALSFVAGKDVSLIVSLGEEIYDEIMADKIYAGSMAMARAHLDAGQRVWLVTATPQELAEIIAERLGFTGAMGTVAESENGKYTGQLVGDLLHGKAKAAAVRALAAKEGLNLKRCTAYSDSINDVPMLSVVGTAVAVNPDSALREEARIRGWRVEDFRSRGKAAVPAAIGAGLIGALITVLILRRRGKRLTGHR